jgi:hypothetical protein
MLVRVSIIDRNAGRHTCWNYQVYGKSVDEPADGQTFAEETRQLFRLKVGFNF